MDPKFSPEFIDELVEFINSKINLPILNEQAEALLFKSLLTALFQLIGPRLP